MGCIYSDFNGHCTMWDEDQKGSTFEDSPYGWEEEGYCVCEEDPDPAHTCEMYESDDPNEDEEEEEY